MPNSSSAILTSQIGSPTTVLTEPSTFLINMAAIP